jgi:hypothetical protein
MILLNEFQGVQKMVVSAVAKSVSKKQRERLVNPENKGPGRGDFTHR